MGSTPRQTVGRRLGLPEDRTNPNGSGISLGHPIGATGAVLMIKALYELARTGGHPSFPVASIVERLVGPRAALCQVLAPFFDEIELGSAKVTHDRVFVPTLEHDRVLRVRPER